MYILETTLPLPGAGEKMTPQEWEDKYGYINVDADRGFFRTEKMNLS